MLSDRLGAILAAVEYAQHHNPSTIMQIAKNVHGACDTKRNLTILFASGQRTPEFGMTFENSRFPNDFGSNDACQMWISILKEKREAIEVGQRWRRPLQFHRSRHGLNAGVPQVFSQCSTSSWATVGAPALIASH